MSKHNKTEYKVLAGNATRYYEVDTLHDFLAWLVDIKHFKHEDIQEDYDLIKEIFDCARHVRKEEKLTNIHVISKCLENEYKNAIKHKLVTEDEINDILHNYGIQILAADSNTRNIDTLLNEE
jgi:predicted AlkP superfamily pyrophosphatase or phosphodiesterase